MVSQLVCPQKTIKQLWLFQNAAARVLSGTKRTELITPVLESLHWLPVSYRIDFKVLSLVYKSLNGLGPEYISDMFKVHRLGGLLDPWTGQLVELRAQTKHGEAAFSCYSGHN